MKKKMLIILSLIMTLTSIFAIDVEVGNGTGTASAVPIWGLYGYNWSNFIVPASFIGLEMEITELKVNVSNSPENYSTTNQKVYLKHTDQNLVPIGYPNPEQNGYTLIFEGDLVWDGSGWQGFELDTPFMYDGTSNLQVVWENRHGTWAPGSPHFFVTEAGENSVVVGASDAGFPVDLPGLTESYFANLLLTYDVADEPAPATIVAPVDFTTDTATTVLLEWELGANTTDVDVYFSDILPDVSNLNASAKVVDGQNLSSFEVSDLDLLTTYYWRVVTRNSAYDLTANSPMWRFTTGSDGLLTPVTVGDGDVLSYQMPLNYFYYYSLAETIYLADEINIGGELQGITYYNNFGFNVLDSFVNVWVGETEQTDLTAYIPPSQLTQVFSGILNIPSGENEVNIMFDTPIVYGGGNLVVLVGKPLADDYYLDTELFYNTETELTHRTLYWQNDVEDLDPENIPIGSNSHLMPNTTFHFVTDGMGSVTGTVTDGTSPLAGANITIEGTNNETISDVDGTFEFPYITAGEDYTLVASLHGYHDAIISFDVIEDQVNIVDVTMNNLETVTVSGQIVGSDTNLGVQADFILSGYETYEVTTDANGNFTFPDVYANMSYMGAATASGYQYTSMEVVVGNIDLDLGAVIINEALYPVTSVVASYDGDDALITWNEPFVVDGLTSFSDDFEGDLSNWSEIIEGPGTPGENGIPYWVIGAPDDPYDGNCLRSDWGFDIDTWAITPYIAVLPNTSINFEFSTSYEWFVNPYGNGDLSVKVSTDGENWTELWVEEDYGLFNNWEWLNVNIPLTDYVGQSLQVAFNVTGSDAANLHMDNVYIGSSRTNSNFVIATPNINVSNATKSITSANGGYSFTNNKRASLAQNINPSSRTFDSYNLYRFLTTDEDNMDNWTLVDEDITDLTYTDSEWSNLEYGFYKYAITAVYTNDAESIPAISNYLLNSDMTIVTVNISSDLDDPVAEANITLTGQSQNPDGEYDVYTAVTDASGTVDIPVNVGMYDISITATGYSPYAGEVDASSNVTVNVTMTEVILPPTAVTAEHSGSDVLITWGLPGEGGTGEWITKGAEENQDGIGTGSAVVMSVSQMYTEAELADYQGMYINAIKFFPREFTATYTLKVWGGADGNTELYSQNVTGFVNEAWNEYTLDSSVAIPTTGPVYIGYIADTPQGFPAGADAGPAVPGGDMIKLGDQVGWDVLSEIAPSLNINWNLQAYVSWARGAQVASSEGRRVMQRTNSQAVQNAQLLRGNLEAISNPTTITSRALEGYKVWRFLTADQTNEANWTLLTPNMITELSHTDTSWDALPSGAYKYAVKANYSNDNMSPAAFSNILYKDIFGTVDGMVMSNGSPVNEATVTLDGNSATTDASGYFIFTSIFAGEYNITASAAGYVSSTQTITVTGNGLTTVDFNLAESNVLISDGFESYPDFALEAAPWTLIDGDLSTTYSINGATWENAEAPQAYIVFNPSMTTPPLSEDYNAFNGSKFMAAFASTTPGNDDWMITQEFTLGESGTFNFWGKSVTADYGLERFNVLVSDGSTNPNDFTVISGPNYVQAPVDWTQYSYSLDAYANQNLRVAIQCVSNDAFIFMVDDVEIDAPGGTGNEDNNSVAVSQLKGNYPNPFNPETSIAFSTKENGPVSLDIYNIKGQKVRSLLSENREAGNHNVVWNGKDDNGKSVASGVFFYRMKTANYSSTKKMILMK